MSDTQQHITNTYAARILDATTGGRSVILISGGSTGDVLTLQADGTYLPETLGSAAGAEIADFATAAQGALADDALQPGDNVSDLVNDSGYATAASLATVATSGSYNDLIMLPHLGSAAAFDEENFAAATHTHATSDITSGTFADARIAESNVTQHEDALTLVESAPIFLSPQDSYATAATNVVDFVVPFAMSLTSVEFRCREGDPPTGAAAQMDCLLAGTTIFSTNPTIDTGEFSSTTAAVPPVLSANPTALTAGQRLQFDLDQVGASDAGRGYYCILRGTRTNA